MTTAARDLTRQDQILDVLEGARDAEDKTMIAACERLLKANRLGWRKHHDPKDWNMVRDFWTWIGGAY